MLSNGDAVDPWGVSGRPRTKPLVVAVQGWCLTAGIELLLAADIRVAGVGARFSQLEVRRGLYPFGGATLRFPYEAGWGNAMRWMLTGDEFDSGEALRLGLVQEVVADGAVLSRAATLAARIAEQAAPLAARQTVRAARAAQDQGWIAARSQLPDLVHELLVTSDAAEGVASFADRRPARFRGR